MQLGLFAKHTHRGFSLVFLTPAATPTLTYTAPTTTPGELSAVILDFLLKTIITVLSAGDRNFEESYDRSEISDFILFYQKYPFGELFSKYHI